MVFAITWFQFVSPYTLSCVVSYGKFGNHGLTFAWSEPTTLMPRSDECYIDDWTRHLRYINVEVQCFGQVLQDTRGHLGAVCVDKFVKDCRAKCIAVRQVFDSRSYFLDVFEANFPNRVSKNGQKGQDLVWGLRQHIEKLLPAQTIRHHRNIFAHIRQIFAGSIRFPFIFHICSC